MTRLATPGAGTVDYSTAPIAGTLVAGARGSHRTVKVDHGRIVITGGPRTGKTTMAREMVGGDDPRDRMEHAHVMVRHTDDLIEQCKNLGGSAWSEASRIASTWLDEPGPWIIEGVAMSRALRKWAEAHPGEPPPVDRVIYLAVAHESLDTRQIAMAKGVETVHSKDVEPWLLEHGITTEYL